MGAINLPSNLLDRIKRAEQSITELWKSIGLSSATIAAGGLTLINNAFFKMLGATNNEILYIGPDGLGNQIVRIRDAAGNIIFGNVSAGAAGQRVAINPNPSGPARIEFYDDSGTTDRVSLSLNGANFVQQREAQADSSITGGKVVFFSGSSFFGHQLTATGAESYVNFLDDERIYVKGKWGLADANSGHSALFVSSAAAGAGPIGIVRSYGATMVGTMHPLAILEADLADRYWAITASSTTGFTLTVSGGSTNTIHYWAFRTS